MAMMLSASLPTPSLARCEATKRAPRRYVRRAQCNGTLAFPAGIPMTPPIIYECPPVLHVLDHYLNGQAEMVQPEQRAHHQSPKATHRYELAPSKKALRQLRPKPPRRPLGRRTGWLVSEAALQGPWQALGHWGR
eukprot:4313192-Pyramimonas_sp.AAC.2